MANRYWVGGTNTNWITFGNWAATSGGPNTASVPTSSDDVFFDANSGTGTVKIAASGNFQTAYANNLNTTGYAGTIDVGVAGGYFNKIAVYGNLVKGTSASFINSNPSGGNNIELNGVSKTITSNGGTFGTIPTINSGASYTLTDAFASYGITIGGTLTTANYSMTFTASALPAWSGTIQEALSVQGGGTFNMGSSTVTCGTAFITGSINPGTSTLAFPAAPFSSPFMQVNGQTFYNVSVVPFNTGYASRGFDFQGAFTCTNLTIAGGTPPLQGGTVTFSGNITVTGTFTVTGVSIKERPFLTAGSSGAGVTITANAASLSYADFQNIHVSGAAAPVSGTSLGNFKRNSGITFTAAKTVYLSTASAGVSWLDSNVWATSSGGAGSDANYPLAQDTAIINDSSVSSGGSLDVSSSITYGSIRVGDVSFASRTTPLALSGGAATVGNITISSAVTGTFGPAFYNNTSVTYTPGSTTMTGLTVDCYGTDVTLAASTSLNNAFNLYDGTFNLGSSTLAFVGANSWLYTPMTATAVEINTGTSGVLDFQGTGTGFGSTIYMENVSGSVIFSGSGTIKFSNPTTAVKKITIPSTAVVTATIDQAGPGTLEIVYGGSFQNITNSYSSTGATTVKLYANQTYSFASFNLSGSSGKLCTLTCSPGRATIRKASGLWYMGLNSTNGGNNSGLVFTGGGGIDYLSVSNINGITEQNGALIFF